MLKNMKYFSRRKPFLTAFLGVFCLALTSGCGLKVTGVQVTTSIDPSGNEWVDMNTQMTTGSFSLGSIQLPIGDPLNPQLQYGTFGVTTTSCLTCPNGNTVAVNVDLNLTKVTKASTLPPLLPNGTPLPVGGLPGAQVITLPVGNTGALLYFASGPNVAMLGAAVPFSQLAVVGSTIPGANIFPSFSFNTPAGPLAVLAGIFTGAQSHGTGIGFFADLSVVVPHSPTLSWLTGTEFGEFVRPSFRSKLRMTPVMPSRNTQQKVQDAFRDLKDKNLTLDPEGLETNQSLDNNQGL